MTGASSPIHAMAQVVKSGAVSVAEVCQLQDELEHNRDNDGPCFHTIARNVREAWTTVPPHTPPHPTQSQLGEGSARVDPRRRLGARGEQLAAEHLERLGYRIVGRNY